MRNGRVRAEAAAWLARLRSEERSRADESAFRAWLAEDAAHAAAFEDLTAAWDSAGAYVRQDPVRYTPMRHTYVEQDRTAAHANWTRRAALAGGAGVAAGAAFFLLRPGRTPTVRYAAAAGERRFLTLADRSQVTLDGDSELEVAFTPDARRLALLRGRAYFDVAHDPARPFIARAGEHEVIALGTAFEIDNAPAGLSVLLVEGKVAVRSRAREAYMRAGDRLVYRGDRADPLVDRPDLTRLTAWQRGQLIFDDERLSSAVAQMNRYSSRPMAIADSTLDGRRVSGTFSIADPVAFARSVGVLLDAPVAISAAQIAIGRQHPSEDRQTTEVR